MEKIVIAGSGPAGLTASIYASRANLEPLCITGAQVGGQLTTTTLVENWPGAKEGVMGPQLMMDMKEQAGNHGTRFNSGEIESIETEKDTESGDNIISLNMKGGETIKTHTFIVATGAKARVLGLENEEALIGKGVHTCATCDGAFYRDKHIIIVGGGDSAMEEANFLTRFAHVTLMNRSENFRASPIMLERTQKNEKITMETSKSITKYIDTDGKLTGVEVTDIDGNTETREIDGVFLAIGHVPNTSFLGDKLTLDELHYVKLPGHTTETEIEGIFCAGDVHDQRYRQAITSAGFGCMAALDAQRYLEENDKA